MRCARTGCDGEPGRENTQACNSRVSGKSRGHHSRDGLLILVDDVRKGSNGQTPVRDLFVSSLRNALVRGSRRLTGPQK